ncbi:M20/M25/M40 family metallo-hydrolase [Actinoalloteichus hymeniacidonis]|uniref:M20/M25/M40 family peptidase n=1 Tax=Actinoalloteichus hymeniacidonis TaxID=340345 RepID=A0AAC9HVW3_9PSEU|nr:M20/M25/M40 family metallo-hydrolase [Actinoalloteichus hymeniacidonis]AOS66116.1 M20/M25/M40 family peptidase [Actinoalloteichus hymeniacidonis]MBB5905780.1 acetylornithine deacetylase/succinyl-diaminopimelate desuccinylase-like protein [Actinoalloteichus hymeniacidonis]
MTHSDLTKIVQQRWDDAVLPSLQKLVEIPALSPVFDPDWATTGHLDAAVEHVQSWIDERGLTGATSRVLRLPGRTPLLVIDVPATAGAEDAGTALLYGHLDKQPPVGGWSEGLGPWTPVVRDGRLYGRGSADDGYAAYAATTALEALRAAGGAHARAVILLETGEESGSPDLPAYLAELSDDLGEVGLVVCLDSGAGDYDRMWLTTSLRGMVQLQVTATVLDAGQHSGMASGVVPSSFRVLRVLLDRIEDARTGAMLLPELSVEVPANRVAEVRAALEAVPGLISDGIPMPADIRPMTDDPVEQALNNTWRPTLSVIGGSGLPDPASAGNVLRPSTTLALSFRLPPTADPDAALAALREVLTSDVPYGARVELDRSECAPGWNAPDVAPWLDEALSTASSEVFSAPWRTMGIGGSIPFMGLLHAAYPAAQFVVTGALGPGSNAHVPDESLHLNYAAKITAAVSVVLDAHARQV